MLQMANWRLVGASLKGSQGLSPTGKGLIELQGEGLKEGSIGGSWNGGFGRYERDGAFVIDEGPEGDRKVGVCFAEDRGGKVWPADSDKGFIGVGGLNCAGGIEPSGSAREGRRALGGGGLEGVRDLNSTSTRRLCLRLGLARAPGDVVSCGRIKLRSATMHDIRVGMGGGRQYGSAPEDEMRMGWVPLV